MKTKGSINIVVAVEDKMQDIVVVRPSTLSDILPFQVFF